MFSETHLLNPGLSLCESMKPKAKFDDIALFFHNFLEPYTLQA